MVCAHDRGIDIGNRIRHPTHCLPTIPSRTMLACAPLAALLRHSKRPGCDPHEAVSGVKDVTVSKPTLDERLAVLRARPFERTASVDDIYHCFRLLLGRPPNTEEWRGHMMREGDDLSSVVASYVNSLEFARIGLASRGRSHEAAISDIGTFKIYSDPADVAIGQTVRLGDYEPEVSHVIRKHLRTGMAMIDIGANIGWFTMLAAAIVGPSGVVLAVEPNARNVRLLEASRRLNGFENVTVIQAAAGSVVGLLALHTSHSNGTTSAPSEDVAALLEAETVASLPVDLLTPVGRRIDLIKIDVEGAEYLALMGLRKTLELWRPMIVSEFSPDLMPDISGVSGEAYLRFLADLGYEISVIEPDGSTPAAQPIAGIMERYRERESDHIDIVCRNRRAPPNRTTHQGRHRWFDVWRRRPGG